MTSEQCPRDEEASHVDTCRKSCQGQVQLEQRSCGGSELGRLEEEEGNSYGWNRASKKAVVGDEVRGATGSKSSRAMVLKLGSLFGPCRSFKIILMLGLYPGQLGKSYHGDTQCHLVQRSQAITMDSEVENCREGLCRPPQSMWLLLCVKGVTGKA